MARQSRRCVLQAGLAMAGFGLLSGCGIVAPRTQPPRVHRIGYLAGAPPNPATLPPLQGVQQGLRDLGYVEGQDLLIEWRNGDGDDRLDEPAAELVRLRLEVIVVPGVAPARAARAATTTIPIVSAGTGDLVAGGLADSLARPGGNVTGLSTPFLAGKQLQLLQEAVPTLSRVAVLFDATIRDFRPEPFEAAARGLGLQLQFAGAGRAEDLELVFEAATRERADGLFVAQGPVLVAYPTRIDELALQSRLPSMWEQTRAVGRGGLMGYGPNRADLYRRAATYVDKILKGAKPADIPVEQPTTFDFIVNLKTAQALGLTIPQSVLQQATEVVR